MFLLFTNPKNLTSGFLRRDKAKYEDLRVPWLPAMKIYGEAPDAAVPVRTPRVDQIEQFGRFDLSKEWRIKEFSDPIHLVCVRQVESDLDVFVRILDDYQTVVVDVGARVFSFKKNRAALLHFRCAQA